MTISLFGHVCLAKTIDPELRHAKVGLETVRGLRSEGCEGAVQFERALSFRSWDVATPSLLA